MKGGSRKRSTRTPAGGKSYSRSPSLSLALPRSLNDVRSFSLSSLVFGSLTLISLSEQFKRRRFVTPSPSFFGDLKADLSLVEGVRGLTVLLREGV